MSTTSSTPVADAIATTRAGMIEQVPPALLSQFDGQAEALAARAWDRAPKPGAVAPSFTLTASTGEDVALADLLAAGPVVLAFYRGDWCPYCNAQLRAYQEALGELEARGAQLVAISPQSADHGRALVSEAGLGFRVLSDEGAAVAQAYGLAFTVSAADREPFRVAGIDVEGSSAAHDWTLPTPGTFVVDTDGTVLFSSVDGDFRRRAEPGALLAALAAR